MAKFTKMHYEFLAKFLKDEHDISAMDSTGDGAVRKLVIRGIARLLASRLQENSATFDRPKFLAAISEDLRWM